MVLKCENRFQNHSKIILDFSTVYIAQSKLLKSRNLEKRFRKLIWFFLVVWFKKIILGGNTKSELCSIMLQSHIILELLFANSFSNWVESRKNSSTAFGKCVQNPTFTFISILLQRRFFCLLKKTKRDAWLVLNYFCISIISVLFKRKKQKKSQKNPSKKFINEKRSNISACFDQLALMLSSLKSSSLSETIIIFHLLQMNSLKITTQ